ncbi:hypothetical protein GCM10023317_37650 [Actinopolymorpha pittospori]
MLRNLEAARDEIENVVPVVGGLLLGDRPLHQDIALLPELRDLCVTQNLGYVYNGGHGASLAAFDNPPVHGTNPARQGPATCQDWSDDARVKEAESVPDR